MNSSILDLSHRLQKALDNNYNVTDMATVLAVISVLEVSTITKEQLETTRLAKFINHLRRKTKNESLARRSKNLIKKWRKMLMPTLAPTATTTKSSPAQPTQTIQTKLQQKQQLPTQIHSSNGQNNKNSDSLDGSSSCSSSLNTKTKILSKKPINFVNFINQAEIYQRTSKTTTNQYLSDDRSSSPQSSVSKIVQPPTKSEQIALLLMENERSISPLAQKSTIKKIESFSDDTKSSSNHEPSIDLIQDSISSSCDILLNLNKSMTSIETAAGNFSEKKSSKKKQKKVKRKRKENETESDDEPVIFPYHDSLSNTESLSRFSLTNYMTPLPQQESGITTATATATATTTTTFSSSSSSLNPADLTFSGKFNQSTNFPAQIDENEPVLIESSDDGEDSSSFTNFSVADEPVAKPIEQPIATTNLVTDSRSISPFIDSGANSNGSNPETQLKIPTKVPTSERSELVKKRGRKKGSKGADFLMSNMGYFGPGSAVYETASYLGIKSKIASFSGSQKKVKTTKELLADIQNKKIGSSTTSSPIHSLSYAQNLSPSSGSDMSQHSNSNLTDPCNRSTTATPVSLATANTPEPIRLDETISVQSSAPIHLPATPNSIEQKIIEIYNALPPIEPDVIQLNDETFCSCIFREKEEEEKEEVIAKSPMVDVEEEADVLEEVLPVVIEKPQIFIKKNPSVCILPKKPVRSIFDLDYDEDFDPGISIVEEKRPIVEDVKILIESEPIVIAKPFETFVERRDEIIVLPIEPEQKWFVEEDANCLGKKIYETDKQQVTKFHIERLHNFCVPGINGNWNCRPDDDDETTDVSNVERIVPKCNHLIIDKIPKDLRSLNTSQTIDCDGKSEMLSTYKISDKNDLLANNNNNSSCKKRRRRTKLKSDDSDVIHSDEPDNHRLIEPIDYGEEISPQKSRRVSRSSSSSSSSQSTVVEPIDSYQFLPDDNNHLLPSFNDLTEENVCGVDKDGNKFKEWFQVVEMKSYNDEILTILPYVVID